MTTKKKIQIAFCIMVLLLGRPPRKPYSKGFVRGVVTEHDGGGERSYVPHFYKVHTPIEECQNEGDGRFYVIENAEYLDTWANASFTEKMQWAEQNGMFENDSGLNGED